MKKFSEVAAGLRDIMKSYLTSLYRRGSSLTAMEKEVKRRVSDLDVWFDGVRRDVEQITKQRVSLCINSFYQHRPHTPYPLLLFPTPHMSLPSPLNPFSCSGGEDVPSQFSNTHASVCSRLLNVL